MKKKILFYIQVPFMDINLEIIEMIKSRYDVHVLIELPSTQLKANIFNLDINLNDYPTITSFWDIAKKWKLEYLSEFFEGCSSVNFVTYKTNNRLAVFKAAKQVIKYINNGKFDRLHFDDFSPRQAFMLPFLHKKDKLIVNIHDPTFHKGEFEWKRFFIRKLFYPQASFYMVFSNYSKNELKEKLPLKSKIAVFNLLPYTVFKKFRTSTDEVAEKDRYISFFGRLSPYKGLDLLLTAIADVLKEFPNQRFYIGGRPVFGYTPNFKQLGESLQAVTVVERHLSNEEIVNLIAKSKLVVCPYIEATQSGVVMTSYALNCPVLVTNTGGLAECVSNNVTGIITDEISAESIAERIKYFLRHNQYKTLHDNLLNDTYIGGLKKDNLDAINTIYA